ncbi:MAG: hypothetical protein GY827_04590 [Cytophagales bacterium]|nr:hypothetical protein [Cytophagales bacterium]
MKYLGDFLNEDGELQIDKFNGEEWFNHNAMTPREFIKKADKPDSEFQTGNAKNGLDAVKFLSKQLPVKIAVSVHRSSWNYGGNFVVTIRAMDKGKSMYIFNGGPLEYVSGDSTTTPEYKMSKSFDGLFTPEHKRGFDSSYTHGSFKSIQKHDTVLQDIVDVFDAYEKKYGKKYSTKEASKEHARNQKIEKMFRIQSEKASDWITKAKQSIKKIVPEVKIFSPSINMGKKRIKLRWDEPRKLRHPDEYGNMDYVFNSKEYANYQKYMEKAITIIEKFADKYDLEVDISA